MCYRIYFGLDLNHSFFGSEIAGFGLGGSTVALFARVGGGIYTKAADLGSDLVGKVESNLP
jgi:K(+)-stimulated pyrophosphate-energized sodium pump